MSKCKIWFFEMHSKSIFDGIKVVLHLEEKLKMSKEEETKLILSVAIVIWITKNHIIRQNAWEVLFFFFFLRKQGKFLILYSLVIKLIKYTMIIQCLRAFPSKLSKILAFNISKSHFINFNNSFYNIPNIKCSIFNIQHIQII